MKIVVIFITLLSLLLISARPEEDMTFGVRSYGSFRKIIEMKSAEGVVGLEKAVAAPHTYAVGEIKDAEGEITVYDGGVWLNYGEDGIETSMSEIPSDERAMQLITAQVEHWREFVIPKNMTEAELHGFVLDQARKLGINIRQPFPFLVDGELTDLVWHVLDGVDIDQGGRGRELHFTKLVNYREHAQVTLIGFTSEGREGFVLPGELWHVHVLFRSEKTAGHSDAFSVVKGAKLRLPVK